MASYPLVPGGNGTSNGAGEIVPRRAPSSILDHTGRPYRGERYDDYPIPRVTTFAALVSSSYRKFLIGEHDIAIKHSRETALSMFRDSDITALLWERMRAVATLPWHIEVENEKDP